MNTATSNMDLANMIESTSRGSRSRTSSPVMKCSKTSDQCKKKSASLPPETVDYLKKWIMSPEHIAHPYPTEQEKAKIMEDTGIEMKQLTNWFVNNRKRFWKPRVEAKLREQRRPSSIPPKADVHDKRDSMQPNNLSLVDVVSTMHVQAPLQTPRRLSVDAETGPAAVPTALIVSPWSVVSEQSSQVSDTASLASSTSSSDLSSAGQETEEFVTKSEKISIHILRPLSVGATPTMEDVTVLPNIPQERVIHTFANCDLTFTVSVVEAFDPKKLQSRRDGEIVRLKKHYLKTYISDTQKPETPVMPKRQLSEDNGHDTAYPRQKFRRVSVELWKEACQSADSIYDQELPSLEEAATLFGYALVSE